MLPNSTWRRDVEAVWKFLHKHYCVEGRWTCGTHIHISLDPFYSLQDLKRIAQAVIHFETALEALVPSERRGNCYAMSNWLNSLELAQKNRSRPESIAYIETRMNRDQLIATMCGNDRDFCWNFRSLLNSDKRTIEFRKPPVSTTAKEALAWAEFAICFIQASIKCESPAKLQQVPPTLRGLLWFLSTNQKLGVNEPDRLEPLWAGKDLNAAFPPVYIDLQTRPLDAEEAFHRIQQADMERIQRLASSAGEPPYW